MKVAVIGGGPAGTTVAYQLAKGNAQVDVYEAVDSVGGMARSIKLWDQTVDIGPHRFFSSDARVNSLWLEVAESDYKMVGRVGTALSFDGVDDEIQLGAVMDPSKRGRLRRIFQFFRSLNT